MTTYDYKHQQWLTGKDGAEEAAKQAREIINSSEYVLSQIARLEGCTAEELYKVNVDKLREAEEELNN